MPKQRKFHNLFHLGLNNNKSPRLLSPGELSIAKDVYIGKQGIIRNGGVVADHASGIHTGKMLPYYGFFVFSTDRDLAGNEDGEDWFAVMDHDTAEVDLYDRDVGGTPGWTTGALDLGDIAGTSGVKGVFFFVDGALRAADGNFGATNRTKWRSYIERTHFLGLAPGGGADNYDAWYDKPNNLAKPTRGLFFKKGAAHPQATNDANSTATNLRSQDGTAFSGMDATNGLDEGDYIAVSRGDNEATIISARVDGDDITTVALSGTWQNDLYQIFPAAGTGFNITIYPSGTTGTWGAGDYELASSFIYDGNQESLLFKMVGDGDLLAIGANEFLSCDIYCTSPFDPRITGGRIYIRKFDTDDEWTLLFDISLRDGVRNSLTAEYSAWLLETATGIGAAATTVYCYVGSGDAGTRRIYAYDPSVDTYESINGFSPDEKSIDIGQQGDGYKTAIVLNRTTYVGNVSRTNKDGKQVVEGDSMYKSMPNRFDTYPLSKRVDVAIRDGESIIKLEGYADRIFQFKERTLYIINASQEREYIEDTHQQKGIKNPGASLAMEYGVVWVNEFGLFLYNGERVINLLHRGDERLIDEDEWSDFITDSALVGYHSKTKQIFVFPTANYTGDAPGGSYTSARGFVYDLVKGAWTFYNALAGNNCTNVAVGWDGTMTWIQQVTATSLRAKEWDESEQALTTSEYAFHEEDFGAPGVIKKIYFAYVIYKNNSGATPANDIANVLYHASDGEDTFAVTNLTGTFLGGQSDWVVAKFTFSTVLECETLRWKIDANVANKLQIKAIITEYKVLPQKAMA